MRAKVPARRFGAQHQKFFPARGRVIARPVPAAPLKNRAPFTWPMRRGCDGKWRAVREVELLARRAVAPRRAARGRVGASLTTARPSRPLCAGWFCRSATKPTSGCPPLSIAPIALWRLASSGRNAAACLELRAARAPPAAQQCDSGMDPSRCEFLMKRFSPGHSRLAWKAVAPFAGIFSRHRGCQKIPRTDCCLWRVIFILRFCLPFAVRQTP